MKLNKKSIKMNHLCMKSELQATLEDDFNVPDTKADIKKIIAGTGDIVVSSAKLVKDKTVVEGRLKFAVLYQSEENEMPVEMLEGEIPFSESCEESMEGEEVQIKAQANLEDLSVSLINSRKISIQALVSFGLSGEEMFSTEAVSHVETPETSVCVKTDKVKLLSTVDKKKDILRIREQKDISSNKPNMGAVFWQQSELRGLDIKCAQDELHIKGEMKVFVIYGAEDAEDNLQFISESMPFLGKVPLQGINESMICDVGVVPSQKSINVKPDTEGEPRMLEVEMVLDLDIKVYEEKEEELVVDLYATDRELTPVTKTASYDTLLMKNYGRCRVSDKIKLQPDENQILQIIDSHAIANIDDTSIMQDGIFAEGALKVDIMYISSKDDERIGCVTREIPFSQKIDVPGMVDAAFYTVRPCVEVLSASMMGSGEIEIKAAVGLDFFVLLPESMAVITEVGEKPFDKCMMKRRPEAVGHIVRGKENMWELAKMHHTTMERIMEENGLSAPELKPGMKLLISR